MSHPDSRTAVLRASLSQSMALVGCFESTGVLHSEFHQSKSVEYVNNFSVPSDRSIVEVLSSSAYYCQDALLTEQLRGNLIMNLSVLWQEASGMPMFDYSVMI